MNNAIFLISLFIHLFNSNNEYSLRLPTNKYDLFIFKNKVVLKDSIKQQSDTLKFNKNEIKSFALNKDSTYFFLIIGNKKNFFGNKLIIYKIGNSKFENLGNFVNMGQNPWKVRVGDLNNDGILEIIVGVWKKVHTEKKYRRRIFIYSFCNDSLKPIWLSSRLSSPLLDFEIFDFNKDKKDELIALELQRNKLKRISVYYLGNFGLYYYKSLQRNLNILNLNNYNLEDTK